MDKAKDDAINKLIAEIRVDITEIRALTRWTEYGIIFAPYGKQVALNE